VSKTEQSPAGWESVRDEVARGLEYSHHRANSNTGKVLEVTSFAYALIELLAEKGVLGLEELDERQRVVGERLAERFRELGMGVVRAEPEVDKYDAQAPEVAIDCDRRLHLCRAACCRLQFALTRQDIEEGIVRWDFGRPYMIAQGPDGYCGHLERDTHRCGIYANRPVPCRAYDCRRDPRIWADFERRIPSPQLEELFEEQPLLQIPPFDQGRPEAARRP
jgi:Fe-S-cluster containining protein